LFLIGLEADLVSFLRFVGVTELIMLTSMAVGLFLASFSANPVVGFYLCTSSTQKEGRGGVGGTRRGRRVCLMGVG
jgi:hypothetical protein